MAQIGYFREEFVEKRKWVADPLYADLVALSQLLPGPISTQVGMGLGFFQKGIPGALAACIGFALPSAVIMAAFGIMVATKSATFGGEWVTGVKIAVVAIVAQALWRMGCALCPDKYRATFAVLAAATICFWPSLWNQLWVILGGAILGLLFLPESLLPLHTPTHVAFSKRAGLGALLLFFVLLFLSLWGISYFGSPMLNFFYKFYCTGSLVFGGGHVLLPLLQSEFVGKGLMSNDAFLSGYGVAQLIPGPLFTFAAYLGGITSGWMGAIVALLAIFLPGVLLCIGILPFWAQLRHYIYIKRAMLGVNAAVVGLVLAAFYQPVFLTAIHSPRDFALAAIAFLLLMFWEIPSWIIVLFCIALGLYGVF